MVDEDPEQESSSKWSLRFLKQYISKKYSKERVKQIFEGCNDAVIKTLICTEPNIIKEMNKCGNRQKCCFEVYGFDIMFDDELNPWVLEVNCLPSLSSSSMFDKQVKTMLICDTFTLIGIRGYNKQLYRKKDIEPAREEEPVFNQTMELAEVEKLGGCKAIAPR